MTTDMNSFSNNTLGTKGFVYFPCDDLELQNRREEQEDQNLSNDMLDKLLKTIGREVLREKVPNLQQLEQSLQDILTSHDSNHESNNQQQERNQSAKVTGIPSRNSAPQPIIRHLIQKGYLKDSQKWLSSKGFITIGGKILNDVMKALKAGDFGVHNTNSIGYGSVTLDTNRKYEPGDDIRLLDVPNSLLNTIQRVAKKSKQIEIPLKLNVDDFQEYETMRDVTVALVYCIDLSSTMRYSSMSGDMSRIEAAKRALWSLFLLNRRYFPSDSIYVVGFGALASKVAPYDIPYLKTFEPGSDFLHYTNYQSAFRLSNKILQTHSATNKRIVLITDGHPSACFIDNKKEQDEILSRKPYSHFYIADKETLHFFKENQDMSLDITSGEVVYLCYRYKQVDQYIGERTIREAKKCHRLGVEIDTIMISEEDSLLGYVNEMEKNVRGRSYYINPGIIDRVLLTDYLNNKKKTIRART
ncbi:MAG: VWA domain-containing protein [Nitrososphaeraceae archaeon]|nr:VWA domain-containing protein [Nitrososphaeraceae archaeon]MBV9668639.1 VWA domain-containing protein [Nitrososphaeraceae archaeon]